MRARPAAEALRSVLAAALPAEAVALRDALGRVLAGAGRVRAHAAARRQLGDGRLRGARGRPRGARARPRRSAAGRLRGAGGRPRARAPLARGRGRAHLHRRAAAARRRQRRAAGGHRGARATASRSSPRPRSASTCAPAARTCAPASVVLEAGARLGPAQLGMLASLGRSVVAVHQRPRVAILSGGDELVEPDGDVAGGRIVSSNSYSIAAQCREVGAEPTLSRHRARHARRPRAPPARRARRRRARELGRRLGRRPRLRAPRAREARLPARLLGRADQARLPARVRPLRRAAAGRCVFGLPGNPVSAMVTFEQFVRPALLRLAGQRAAPPGPSCAPARRDAAQEAGPHSTSCASTLAREGERCVARSTGNQSSGVLRSMTLAQGLLVFPAEASELAEGARADVQVLDADFLAAPEPRLSAAEGRFANVAAAVLIGGASSRMGSDKAQLAIGGEPSATRLAARLASLCEDVLLVGGEPPPERAGRRVPDPRRAALRAARARRRARGRARGARARGRDRSARRHAGSAARARRVARGRRRGCRAPRTAPSRSARSTGASPRCAVARAQLAEGRLALHELLGALSVR